MDKGLIPARYAKALYEVAQEKGASDSIYSVMNVLNRTFCSEPSLAQNIANPFVPEADKVSLLYTAAGITPGSNSVYGDFLKLLGQNHRIDMIWDIARAFTDLYRRERSIYRVSVVSAAPLDDSARKRLDSIIRSRIGSGTMEYDYSIDPSL